MPELNDTTRESLETLLTYWQTHAPDAPWVADEVAAIEKALASPAPLTDEQWDEYFLLLAGPEGVDFEGQFTCGSGYDKTHSTRILRRLGRDVDAVHRIVNALGGHCDCEILMNAAPKILPSWDQELPTVPS